MKKRRTVISFDTIYAPTCDGCKEKCTYDLYFHAKTQRYLCDSCYRASRLRLVWCGPRRVEGAAEEGEGEGDYKESDAKQGDDT